MTAQRLFLTLTIGLHSLTLYCQSIKDYFIPDSTHNKMSYYHLSPTGQRVDWTGSFYYTKKNTTYDVMKAQMMQGDITAVQTMTIKFTKNEVKMIKSVSTTMTEKNHKVEYNPPSIILKLPPAGQTISWSYKDITGENVQCTALWTTVEINGTEKKAIKKVMQYSKMKTKLTEYYVINIGFWQSEMEGAEGRFTFQKFDGLDYDATAK